MPVDVTTSTSECSDGDSVRLLNYTRVDNYYADLERVYNGRVSGCVNSQYVDICADDSSDLEAIAQRACDYRDYSKWTTSIVQIFTSLNLIYRFKSYNNTLDI